MLYNRVLLLSAVFFVVTLMFNPLFFPLSNLFSNKYKLGMILKHFLVKVHYASEKTATQAPRLFVLFCALGFFNIRDSY